MTILDIIASAASAIVAACVPILVAYLAKKVHLDTDMTFRDALSTTIERGVGVGLAAGVAAGDTALGKVKVTSPAVQAMMSYVVPVTNEARAYFGLTDDRLAEMCAAELNKTLLSPVAPAPVVVSVPVPANSK